MTKAFIAGVLHDSITIKPGANDQTKMTMFEALRVTDVLVNAIVDSIKQDKRFRLPNFGTFKVAKLKASKTVRFKASPHLRKSV